MATRQRGDLKDLFAYEHRVRMKGTFKQRWNNCRSAMLGKLFPQRTEAEVAELLDDRRFVVLPGATGNREDPHGLGSGSQAR